MNTERAEDLPEPEEIAAQIMGLLADGDGGDAGVDGAADDGGMSGGGKDGLPAGWAWASMSDLTSYVTSGSRDWSEFYSNAGALFIRTQDINTNTLRWSESAFVQLPEHVEGKRALVERGDMLITITGANVGKCALVEEDIPEAYVSQSVALVKLVDAQFGPVLRLACLRPLGSGETVLQKIAYGLGRPVLSLKQIRELQLPVAPLNEQKRIVAKIEALQARSDAARQALNAIPPLLEKFRQSVLAAAFRGDLTRSWREAHPDAEPASELLKRIRAERRRRWEEANPKKQYTEPEPVDASGLPELPEGWCWAS
jgi:type I restriction enzyme S subunit